MRWIGRIMGNGSVMFDRRRDPETIVTIELQAQADNSTVVKVTEDGKEYNEQNMEWLISNVGGWASFLNCMKAYLDMGCNFGKGRMTLCEKLRTNHYSFRNSTFFKAKFDRCIR